MNLVRGFAGAAAVLSLSVVVSACAMSETSSQTESTGDTADTSQELSTSIAALGFNESPADKKAISLTFDDGPDEVSTAKVLDTLKAEKIKATFFVNTHNTTNLAASPAAQEALRRMYAEGHEVGNHSVHHYDLNKASVDVEAELAGVENAVHAIVPDAPRMSLVRTPFGNPFFGPVSRLHVLEPIIHKHGMHIGWQIDTNDWKCVSKGADCVTANLKEELAAGYHGILLMHSTHATSAAALPEVIRILRAEGFHFVSVEDLVKAKYGGKTSSQVLGR